MAIATVTMSTFDGFLKQYYIDGKNMIIADAYENKLLTAVPKLANAAGKTWNVGVPLEQVGGTAGNRDVAKAVTTAGTDVDFTGKWKERYAFASLDDKVISLSRTPDGAFEPALTAKIASTRTNFMAGVNYQLFRTEAGDIGRLTSFGGNNTVATGTLTTNTAVPASQRLKVNSVVQFSSARGGSVRAGTWKVVSIQDGGVLGFQDAASSGSTTPSPNDYVYFYGDAQDNATSANTTGSLAGVESWVPSNTTDALSDFKGVTRGLYGPVAQGVRIDATGKRPSEALALAGITARRVGAQMTQIYMHPTRFYELTSELQGQQRFETVRGKTTVKLTKAEADRFGFQALQLANGGGDVMIVDDWACQYAFSWGLEMRSWTLRTQGAFPRNRGVGTDGLQMLRQDGTSYLFEILGYGELLCYAPGHNVCIQHSTAA
jgi:hypothetical protein